MGRITATWRQRFRLLILIFLGLAIALMTNFPFLAAAQSSSIINKSELRGVWLTNIDSDVLFSRQNLNQAMQRLKRLKFNTIYPTVWNSGYTLYPSSVAERTFGKAIDSTPELQGRDMLAEAVEIGHSHGLSVIPWFEYGLMTEDGTELSRLHPEWLTSRKDGSTVFVSGEKGQHRVVWLNPVRPEVQKLLVDLIVEVATKYDVDGIQLDDHFGMPVELGYDDYTVALYQKEHQGKRPPDNINDPEWMSWRAKFVTDLMAKIFTAVKAVKPNCLISLSPNPKDFSYIKYLQDWYTWAQRGLIEELIVQVYRSDFDDFKRELERPELQEIRRTIPVAIGILTGLRILNVDMRQIQGQVKTTRELAFNGFSFFFYETLGRRDSSFESLLYTPAIRPDAIRIATKQS